MENDGYVKLGRRSGYALAALIFTAGIAFATGNAVWIGLALVVACFFGGWAMTSVRCLITAKLYQRLIDEFDER